MTLRDTTDEQSSIETTSAPTTSTSATNQPIQLPAVATAGAATGVVKTVYPKYDLPEPGQPKPTGMLWGRNPDVQSLVTSLRYRRPKGGKTEEKFIMTFLDTEITDLKQDECGNIYKLVGKEQADIVWSCHLDSVHRMEGQQAVVIDGDWIRLPRNSKSNCLGADDMAGIWLMRQMIAANVPGLYIFHYGEESGGIGSGWIADHHPEYLKGIKFAVAFDRRNFLDVITHQAGGRCCSDSFATSLARLLPDGYRPSRNGIFTDTANYTSIIPECTNLSVGYQNEHTTSERLNIPHILALRDKLVQITQADLDGLVLERDPTVKEFDEWEYFGMGHFGRSYSRSEKRKAGVYVGKYGTQYQHLGSAYDRDDTDGSGSLFPDHDIASPVGHDYGSFIPDTLEELLEKYPKSCARVLSRGYGMTAEDMWLEIQNLVRTKD